MRFFTLLSFQHIILYLFPALIFIIIFGMSLGYTHFRTKSSEGRKKKIHNQFPEDIEGRKAPFPLAMVLIVAGTIAWTLFYILGIGLLGVKI